MTPHEAEQFGAHIADLIKTHVASAMAKAATALDARLSPILTDLAEVKAGLAGLPTPRDGLDADPDAVAAMVHGRIKAQIDVIEAAVNAFPEAPELPELPDFSAMITDAVAAAVAAIPAPKDGTSVTIDDVLPVLEKRIDAKLELIPLPQNGEPGKSVTPEDVLPDLIKHVDAVLANIPVPKNGIDGKDGLGLTGAMISRDGALVLTLADGSTKDVGKVVGNDAEPGAPGADGLGFEDMTEELTDDGRTIIRRYQRGDLIKEFRHTFAVVLDRGVYKEGGTYAIGDGVTWGGSWWIKQADASGAPGDGPGWRLAVKRGQNGRDAKTEPPEPAKPVRLK